MTEIPCYNLIVFPEDDVPTVGTLLEVVSVKSATNLHWGCSSVECCQFCDGKLLANCEEDEIKRRLKALGLKTLVHGIAAILFD